MFTTDVPSLPRHETPVVLAQAVNGGARRGAQQPDFLLKVCQETESSGDPQSAMRSIDPSYMLKNFLQNRDNHYVDIANIKNITLLEGTAHGKITTEVDNTGRTLYGYDPEASYAGKDKAVFMAEFEGKRYKIVLELHVFILVNEKLPSSCPSPQLIKANSKSISAL